MTSAILCPKRTVHKMKLNEPEKVEFTKALIPTLCAIIRGADSYPFCHNQTALLCQCPYDVFYTGRRTVPQTLASVLLAAIPASGGLWRCGPSHSPSGRMVFRQCCQHTETHRCTHTHTRMHACTYTCTQTQRGTHTHTHTHMHAHTHTHTRTHIHMHANTQAHTHTHTHACTHRHTHTHTRTHTQYNNQIKPYRSEAVCYNYLYLAYTNIYNQLSSSATLPTLNATWPAE